MSSARRTSTSRCSYCDTDSVYYETWPGAWEPNTGTMLGDWEAEFDLLQYITEWAALAPKTLAYKTNTGAYGVKSKGMTLNKRNYESVNFNTYKEMVHQQRETLVGDQMLFSKSKRGIVTKHTDKVLTMDRARFKREIMPDGTTRPWRAVS